MKLLSNPAPVALKLELRQGDTFLFDINFTGPGGGPLPPGELELLEASAWQWQVRANRASGKLIGDIHCTPIPDLETRTFTLRCFLPRATSQALVPQDLGENFSDLERLWTQGGYDRSLTVATMQIIAADDTTVPVLTAGGSK